MNEDRSASFVELFFDLVFVFGITQVVATIHGHIDWPTLWRAAVILLLLWWSWTQFTWLAGVADFDELRPRITLLAATAGTFTVAVSVQEAWGNDGTEFGLSYFAVMALAAVFMYVRNVGTERIQGIIAYASPMMLAATLVLIGGFVEGDARTLFWLAAVAVNFASTTAASRYEYEISAAHFAERHGLFVIIVLGEVLIAIGLGTVGHPGTAEFFIAGTAMLVVALAMWWSYFDWLFRIGEKALKGAVGVARSRMARDAYSFGHYPMIAGVVLFAVGTEVVLAHPELALDTGARWAFVGGLILYLASQSAMVARLTGSLTWERFGLMAALVVVGFALGDLSGATLVALVAAAFVVGLGTETARHREALSQLR